MSSADHQNIGYFSFTAVHIGIKQA